jgi:hypothetical protein
MTTASISSVPSATGTRTVFVVAGVEEEAACILAAWRVRCRRGRGGNAEGGTDDEGAAATAAGKERRVVVVG